MARDAKSISAKKRRQMTRDFLNSYLRLKEQRRQIEDCLARVRSDAESTTAAWQDVPGGSGKSDKVAKGATDAADLTRELRETDIEANRKMLEIMRVIDRVKDYKRAGVLSRRHISGMTYPQIARDMGLSERWIFDLYNSALDDVAEILIKTNRFPH